MFLRYFSTWIGAFFTLMNLNCTIGKTFSAAKIFISLFFHVFEKQKGAGAVAAIRNFGSGSGRIFNLGLGSTTRQFISADVCGKQDQISSRKKTNFRLLSRSADPHSFQAVAGSMRSQH
jgi:hypothetical protein